MGARRSDSTLSDAVLERELEQALAVDPSPEFLARVRTRIADEPTRSTWHFRLAIAVVGPAAAIIVGVLLLRSDAPQRLARPDVPLIAAQPVGVPFAGLAAAIVPHGRPAASGRSLPSISRYVRPAFPAGSEVLIAADEAAMLRRLLRAAPPRSVALLAFADRPVEIAGLQPLPEIELAPIAEISPITIEPLRLVAREEGARQ